MKTFYTRLIIFIFSVVLLSSHTSNFENNYIWAFGSIKYENNKISGVSVKILHQGNLVEKIVTSRNGAYGFELQFNTIYQIELLKEGYLKEILNIDTHVPDEVISYTDRLLWEPDWYIYKIVPGLTLEEFERPVANYVFNTELWEFTPEEKYKTEIEPLINKVLTTINTLKEEAYIAETSSADSLFDAKNYEEAIIAYNKAQEYNLSEKYPASQIKAAKNFLKEQYTNEEGYRQAITNADNFFARNDLNTANEYYQKALIYKPKENYPLDRLYAIDSLRSYQWLAKVSRYDNYVSAGDSLFAIEKYEASKSSYVGAINLFPRLGYPKEMIKKADSIFRIKSEIAERISLNNLEDNSDEKYISHKIPESKELASQQVEIEKTVKAKPEVDKIEAKNLTLTIGKNNISDKEQKMNLDSSKNNVYNKSQSRESLKKLEKTLKETIASGNKNTSSQTLEEIGLIYQNEFDLKRALESYNKSLLLKRELGDKKGESQLLSNIANVMYDSGSYISAIQNFEQSLKLSEDIYDKAQSADILLSIATVYENTYRYSDAVDALNKSLNIKQEIDDEEGISEIHKNIGNIYYEQNKFDLAVKEFKKSILINEQKDNKEELMAAYNNLGATYYSMKKYDKAVDYYEKSLEITRETNNPFDQSITLNNIGNINFDFRKYNKAIEYYEQSLKLKTDLSFKEGMVTSLYNIGNAYYALKQQNKALEYYQASMKLAEEVNYREMMWKNYEAFAKTYASLGGYKKAFQYYKQYTDSKYEINAQSLQVVEMRELYESSKITVRTLKRELQKQNRIARYEAERNRRELEIKEFEIETKLQQLRKQQVIIVAFLIGSLIVIIFSLIITKQYRLKNKAFNIVAEQKKHITDGIAYAARIQNAVLPPDKYIQSVLPERFILNKPRDLVGGDFYWVAQHYNKTIIAVADCTGHGVPGGFMSMLGIAILNEVISIEQPLESHEILTHLRDRVIEALHQKHRLSESLDGMDISLIVLDPETKKLQYSAAYHSLYIVRDNKLEIIKGDRAPIGYHHLTKHFSSKTIALEPGDMLYLSTDGYTDQIGEKSKNRFMLSNFTNELLSICNKPLNEQKEHLEKAIEGWKGKMEQTDDILIFGLRI